MSEAKIRAKKDTLSDKIGASNVVSESAEPKFLLSGLDSLYVSYFFSAKLSNVDWEELAFQKERLKAGGSRDGQAIRLGCERFMLQPYGSKPYTYVLRNRYFIVRLAENMNPCCHVQFLSEGLWENGPQKQVSQFELWAASVGFTNTRMPVVSRADWAFDFQLSQIDFDENDFVSLSRKDSKHRADGKAQTFTFGTGDKLVRIYDKTVEIEEKSGKTYFYQIWKCRENIWRIEFQMRGEGLRQFGIRSPSELFARQIGLLLNSAQKHTSLRVPSGDKNRSRWPLHPLWRALLDAIQASPQTVRSEPLGQRTASAPASPGARKVVLWESEGPRCPLDHHG